MVGLARILSIQGNPQFLSEYLNLCEVIVKCSNSAQNIDLDNHLKKQVFAFIQEQERTMDEEILLSKDSSYEITKQLEAQTQEWLETLPKCDPKIVRSHQEKFEWMVTFNKDAAYKALLKDPKRAAIELAQEAQGFNIKFIQRMRENILGFNKIETDSKADIARIAEKIQQYQSTKQDQLGMAQVKDVIRAAFYFQDVVALKNAFIEFLRRSSPSCLYGQADYGDDYEKLHQLQSKFVILEMKPKLTSIHNITLVVATAGGNIIGEVQMKILRNAVEEKHKFMNHILYELKRMFETPWEQSLRNNQFGKIISKMYFKAVNEIW
eukprot:403336957